MPLGIDYEDICLQTIDLEKESMLGIVGTNELDKNAYVEFLLHLLFKAIWQSTGENIYRRR